ncbi:SemiSWEET transporter [Pseudorhodoplanes sp.]|uniref:SemiSWEET family sugar transporter n=1 Tax=Pseudorhodoplanes sp. TaxID=1934341 RepID=UPI002C9381E9|nr:SemiSWEET transporter [Pseudorhodoplanes sp.]HWV44029.1 SemiSWEET transporter [Pseudorhodoplanes sp.]
MTTNTVTLIGLLAAALTTSANLPQVLKAWRTRETSDLSLKMTVILAAGLGFWVVYGVLQGDAVIVIANAVAMLLALALTVLKLRHG